MIKPTLQHIANKSATPHGLCPDSFPIIAALNAALPNCKAPITPDAVLQLLVDARKSPRLLPHGNKKPLPKVRSEMVLKLVTRGHGLT